MISHRCRYKGRGSVFMRFFTSSIDRCAAALVILAIPSLFWFQSSPPLFYHSTRIGISDLGHSLSIYQDCRPRTGPGGGGLCPRHDCDCCAAPTGGEPPDAATTAQALARS